MEKVLIKIAELLNKENILWAVGSSYLLKEKGLIQNAQDLDIIVDIKDITKVENIFNKIGIKHESVDDSNFVSQKFLEYDVDNVEIDLIAGFKVQKENHIYRYILDDKAIVETKIKEGVKINYTALEDWFVIYQLINGREEKVFKIKEELLKRKNINRFLLQRNLSLDIPNSVKKEIEDILNI